MPSVSTIVTRRPPPPPLSSISWADPRCPKGTKEMKRQYEGANTPKGYEVLARPKSLVADATTAWSARPTSPKIEWQWFKEPGARSQELSGWLGRRICCSRLASPLNIPFCKLATQRNSPQPSTPPSIDDPDSVQKQTPFGAQMRGCQSRKYQSVRAAERQVLLLHRAPCPTETQWVCLPACPRIPRKAGLAVSCEARRLTPSDGRGSSTGIHCFRVKLGQWTSTGLFEQRAHGATAERV
ncbi:hypothetical protein LZ30DRAFT_66124 [Colletotrichum cereale]|nr:hypothetical protein LZ30DRAFT_66124 [Colletotrichum cereale]